MGLVTNNVVKMEWEKSGWLQTSARNGKKSVFIMASRDYETEHFGTVSVIFRPDTAFLFIDEAGTPDEDIWSARDLMASLKEEVPGGFPVMCEQYVPIIESGETECDEVTLETYGLLEYKEDIERRLEDIAPYGELVPYDPNSK